jgi:hypothetical protein
MKDGAWHCDEHDMLRTKEEQLVGCDKYEVRKL